MPRCFVIACLLLVSACQVTSSEQLASSGEQGVGETRYRAQCDSHKWEGMAQLTRGDAELDLQGHKDLLDKEPHRGTRVISYKI